MKRDAKQRGGFRKALPRKKTGVFQTLCPACLAPLMPAVRQKKRNIMTFEFNGKKYKKASSHQKEWGNKIIAEFNFKGNEYILDLGCGDGVLTSQLADMVPNGFVLGIDASEGMITSATQNKKPNLEFQLLDINQLDFKERFDLIFSNAVLHWVKDHKRLLSNTYNALKRDGIIRFNFAADGNCSYFFNIINQTIQKEEYRDYFKDFVWPWFMPTLDQYKKILDNFSFSNVKIWEENADRYFPNKEALIGWIAQPSIVPFLEYLPIDKKEPFTNEVIEKMVKATIQDDGRYFETFRRINVLVTK
jgi:trans-aconitate methyltransferase